MARELTFKIKDQEYSTTPVKIDRKKVYGWTDTLVLDDNGNECTPVSIDESGTLIIPKGGLGLGIISPDGRWVQRSELKAVNEDGSPATLFPSSFGSVIEIQDKATDEEFLDYSIKSFYQMDDASDNLIDFIGNDIYYFLYSYRDGYDPKKAFLLTAENANKEKKLYMMIGELNMFEMLGLKEASAIEEVENDEIQEETDEIDFSMF